MDIKKRTALIAIFAIVGVILSGYFIVKISHEQTSEENALIKASENARAAQVSGHRFNEFNDQYKNIYVDGSNVDQLLSDAQKEVDSGELVPEHLGNIELYQGMALRVKSVNSTDPSAEKQNLIASIQKLYGIFTDSSFSLNTRSRAIIQMDSDIEQACFRYDWLAEALSNVDEGRYYKNFESKLPQNETADRRQGDIGRLMAMDMNQKADEETPDQIFKFWKFYISSNSLISRKMNQQLDSPEEKVRLSGIHQYDEAYRTAPHTSFTQTKYTQMWQRTSVLALRSKLATLFPTEFNVNKGEIFKGFDELIAELGTADKAKRATLGAEYIVRIHYALERFRYDKNDPQIASILEPILKPEFLVNASGIRRFIRGGATRTDIMTFVEMREMAKTQPAFKKVLVDAGWKI